MGIESSKTGYVLSGRQRVALRLLLLGLAVIANRLYQVFCIPVPWATIVLMVCFSAVVLDPVLNLKSPFSFFALAFVQAWALCIALYCIIFLWEMNFVAWILVPFIIGLVAYIPHYFVVRIFRDVKGRWGYREVRAGFRTGLIVALILALGCGLWYRSATARIEAHIAGTDPQPLESMRGFMYERILGLHWKYHTQFCWFDGWRPPLHDPAVVIGYWMNGGGHHVHPPSSQALHEAIFPEYPKPDCRCALFERFEGSW